MANEIKKFSGTITGKNKTIEAEISFSSRYTVHISLEEEQSLRDGEYFDKLEIKTDTGEFLLEGGRFILDTGTNNKSGTLIFSTDLYDFDQLFHENKLINLETYNNNMKLIFSQKESIKVNFISYTSRLTYDLNVYQHYFDDLDKKIDAEPENIREEVRQTLIDTEGQKFLKFFQSRIDELESEVSGYTRQEHELHGFFFRKQVWPLILCSDFMTRTNIKPRGYAGDSEMMRMIYENEYVGNSTFSKLMYKYGVEVPAAQAVRNRRIMVPEILRNVQEDFSKENQEALRIMSVACGPAYELQDLFLSEEDVHKFEITLLDQDTEALREAEDSIKKIEKSLGYQIKANYLQDSVRTMMRHKDIDEKWGTFNLVYSMGLFDYLTPPTAKIVTERMYKMLEPGGQIFIGNFHVANPSKWFMEYWLDWVLYYRSEDEFKRLLRDTDAEDINVFFEESRSQVFLNARKPL